MSRPWSIRIPRPLHEQLYAHLFPGDGNEHGAVIAAGVCESERGIRLLARELFPAKDGIDYVPGERGYRALTARFVAEKAEFCARERLCYLAVHNHSGSGSVEFSPDDLASHERGYPALLDITSGGPVGALVFSEDAVDGDIWLPGGERHPIEETVIVGPKLQRFFPELPHARLAADPVYDRHARLFGDVGQQRLRQLKVGLIGAGGGGSLIVQLLARLGVGHIVVIDHDRVDLTNLPRLVGATRWDARAFLTARRSKILQRIGKQFAVHKVHVAERVARQAQPGIRFDAIVGDVVNEETARLLTDTDVLFLATDTMQSRLVFNSLVHQYLIPGFQVGAKIRVEQGLRRVEEIFSVARSILPYRGAGCMLCNGLIPPARVQQEALSSAERVAQRYIDDDNIAEPSVITLNAISAAHATNDMLMMVTGLFAKNLNLPYISYDSHARSVHLMNSVVGNPQCFDCGTNHRSRLGRGDRARLPCRLSP